MWEKLIAGFRLLWDAGEKVQQNTADIRQLRDNERRLFQLVQHLGTENDRLCDELRHERELRERDLRELKLELRLQISEEFRRLPPPQ